MLHSQIMGVSVLIITGIAIVVSFLLGRYLTRLKREWKLFWSSKKIEPWKYYSADELEEMNIKETLRKSVDILEQIIHQRETELKNLKESLTAIRRANKTLLEDVDLYSQKIELTETEISTVRRRNADEIKNLHKRVVALELELIKSVKELSDREKRQERE